MNVCQKAATSNPLPDLFALLIFHRHSTAVTNRVSAFTTPHKWLLIPTMPATQTSTYPHTCSTLDPSQTHNKTLLRIYPGPCPRRLTTIYIMKCA